MYHFAQCPSFSCGWISDSTHVPAGVVAFHDETSSLNSNVVGYTGDVHVPDWYVPEPSTPSPFAFAYGSEYGVVASPRDASVTAPCENVRPARVPVEKSAVWKLTGYGCAASAAGARLSAAT